MNLRIGVGAALLAVGLALVVLAVSQRGKPWGFRGHAAALLEATHNVELVPSAARAERAGLDDAMLPTARGTFLDAGDGVRVGVHSEARLVLPGGALVVGDSSRATLTEKGARLGQGMLEITVARGAAPFLLELDKPAAELRLRAADADGVFRVFSDGKAEARVHVRSGSVEAAAGAGAQTVTAGKVLALGAEQGLRVEEAPAALSVSASCVDQRVSVQAPAATQLFIDGAVHWPEGGALSVATLPEHPQRSHVLGRDVVGNVAAAVEVACEVEPAIDPLKPRAPAPIAPAPKPK